MQDGKYVILCIDDDEDLLFVLKKVLEANGYTFAGAVSAEEGLKAYKNCQPDLILLDLMMEEVDAGASFVKDLKILGNIAPIFMLSSVGDSLAMMTDTSELGLAGVLQKPIASEQLLTLLSSKLGSST